MRALAPIVVVLGLATTACGGRVPPCAVPTSPEAAWRTLDGTWRVVTWSDELNGTIHFDDDDVEATSDDTRFVGQWSPVSSTDNAHVIRMSFDEATVDGTRQIWAEPTLLDVTVVFGTSDIAWGLQPDGAWTRWERIGGCLDLPEGCATIEHPPGALRHVLDADAVDDVLDDRGTDAPEPDSDPDPQLPAADETDEPVESGAPSTDVDGDSGDEPESP